MRIDLFELVEGLIRGVVYFFYNVLETVSTIVRHPIKGPIQLHRSSLRQDRRQIGGLTFLFLTFMLFYSSLPLPRGRFFFRGTSSQNPSTGIFDGLPNAWIHAPQFDMDRMWPAILGSLISTVAVDGTLRLLMIWRLPKRPAWRAMILASAEYSYLWIVAALALGISLVGSSEGRLAKALLAIALLPLGALPAAAILRRATRRRGQLRSFRRLLAWLFVVIVPFVLAILLGSMASFGAQFLRLSRAAAGPRASVEILNCSVRADAKIEVYGLVSLEESTVRALAPSDFGLYIRPQAIGLEPELFDASDPAWADHANGRYVLVNQNAPQLVRLTFQAPPEVAKEIGEHDCEMRVASKGQALQH